MPTDATTPIERFARSHHSTLTSWLQRSFAAKLTPEDVADVVGRAYADAVAEAGALHDEELRPWVYRVARNRAISLIRNREGEGAVKRSSVALTDAPVGALITDDADAHLALAETEVLRDSVARVHRALEQLPAVEREVLRLCAIDGVSIRSAVELTGLSKKQVEKTRSRALERFKLLVGAPVSEDCRRARALITPGHLVDQPLADWRDAHLSGCLGCQIQGDMAYGKRLQALGPLLPVSYRATGKLQILWAKLTAGTVVTGAPTAKLAAGGAAMIVAVSAGAPVARSVAADPPVKTAEAPPVPESNPAAFATSRATARPVAKAKPAAFATPRPPVPVRRRVERTTRRNPATRRPAHRSARGSAAVVTPRPTPTPTPAPVLAPPMSPAPPALRPTAPEPGSAFSQEFSP